MMAAVRRAARLLRPSVSVPALAAFGAVSGAGPLGHLVRAPAARGMAQVQDHTSKWMQSTDKPSPLELIAAVAPIKVEGRVVACYGGPTVALGHPVEYINLDSPDPNVCKYCGLRYLQDHSH